MHPDAGGCAQLCSEVTFLFTGVSVSQIQTMTEFRPHPFPFRKTYEDFFPNCVNSIRRRIYRNWILMS